MGLPHLAERVLSVLGCEFELEAIQAAKWHDGIALRLKGIASTAPVVQ